MQRYKKNAKNYHNLIFFSRLISLFEDYKAIISYA